MQAGAFHDNLVAPYQGVAGLDLTDAQRRLLLDLVGTYVGWAGDEHAAAKLSEVASHLDETWFSWYGGTSDDSPFYYRVHSPVVLVEFDHHPGVVFDNEAPTRLHVHTVVRTPQRRRLRRRSPALSITSSSTTATAITERRTDRRRQARSGFRYRVLVGVAHPPGALREVEARRCEHVDQPVVHLADRLGSCGSAAEGSPRLLGRRSGDARRRATSDESAVQATRK